MGILDRDGDERLWYRGRMTAKFALLILCARIGYNP